MWSLTKTTAGGRPTPRERPLFFSVYCCCCLANISIPGVGVAVPEFRPFFYVNVADISALENELSYVACEWLLDAVQRVL